jgi:hypothetical protein
VRGDCSNGLCSSEMSGIKREKLKNRRSAMDLLAIVDRSIDRREERSGQHGEDLCGFADARRDGDVVSLRCSPKIGEEIGNELDLIVKNIQQ